MNKDQSIPPEKLEEIDRYVQGIMTLGEQQAFESRIAQDPQLKEWTDEIRLISTGIQEASLQQRLDIFHRELSVVPGIKQSNKGRVITFKRLVAAASVLLILSLSLWILIFKTGNKKDIFSEYYSPDPGLVTAMSRTDNYLFDKAMIDYKTGNYDAAIQVWDSLQQITPLNDTLNYFLGSASLATGKLDKAILYYKKTISQLNSAFAGDANWYLGLAFLKEGRKEEAIVSISRSDHPEKDELLLKLR